MTETGASGGAPLVSRAALLEVRREREVIAEGYAFLDEKRTQIAQEILRRLDDYESVQARIDELFNRAFEHLAIALEAHGLAGLNAHPSTDMHADAVDPGIYSFLGTRIAREPAMKLTPADEENGANAPWRTGFGTEAGRAFAEILVLLPRLATERANLERLGDDFTRTHRRAKALEDVLLPEMKALEQTMEEGLDANDLEEASRIRWFAESRRR